MMRWFTRKQATTQVETVTEHDAPAQFDETAYLLNLLTAWEQYIEAERTHPVYIKRRGVPYNGYASLAEYMAALNAQNVVIAEALAVLADIRTRLYGNEWGN